MNVYENHDLAALLAGNTYPGRGIVLGKTADGSYKMSILKSADAEGSACARYTYEYPGVNGVGHFLHTYVQDGNPIPTFQGEPERVAITGTLDAFAEMIWNNLNEANKISLYVRFTDLATGAYQEKLYNKNK